MWLWIALWMRFGCALDATAHHFLPKTTLVILDESFDGDTDLGTWARKRSRATKDTKSRPARHGGHIYASAEHAGGSGGREHARDKGDSGVCSVFCWQTQRMIRNLAYYVHHKTALVACQIVAGDRVCAQGLRCSMQTYSRFRHLAFGFLPGPLSSDWNNGSSPSGHSCHGSRSSHILRGSRVPPLRRGCG